MKITKSKLQKLVKEELESILEEPNIELEIEQQIDKARFAIDKIMILTGESTDPKVLRHIDLSLSKIAKEIHYAQRKVKKVYHHYSKRKR